MKKLNIVLTYSPAAKEINRICGHTFEVKDYYLFLKDRGYDITILIQDRIRKELIYTAWEDKYDLNNLEYNYKKDILFQPMKNLFANVIIYTNGIYKSDLNIIQNKINKVIYKKLITFRCNNMTDFSSFLQNKNHYLLHDFRVYNDFNIYSDFENSINYVKKFYFSKYRKINKNNSKKYLLIYINSYLRRLNTDFLKKINNTSSKILFVSGSKLNKNDIEEYSKYGKILHAPVKNLFEQFDKYLYTPNIRNFDCSPRLLTECKFYNKEIIINFDITKDIGAYWRWHDIQNNFESLILKEGDDIERFIN
jgi:hypothetical protein